MSSTTTPTMEQMCTETNWPVLKAYLKEGKVSFDALELSCDVCRDTMTVLPDQHTEDEDGMTHNALILPCGHIFGQSCLEAAFEANTSLRPVCFTCRADLTHPECGHMHPGLPMPCSREELDRIPAILSEGGLVSPSCHDCTLVNVARDLTKQVDAFNRSRPNDYEPLMGLSCSPTQGRRNWWPAQFENGSSSECEPPKGALPVLSRFEEQQRFAESGKHWFEGSISDVEWRFHSLKVERPEPTFREFMDFIFSKGEEAKGMTLEELRDEFEGKSPARSTPSATRQTVVALYLMLEEDDEEEDDNDEDDYDYEYEYDYGYGDEDDN